MRRWRAAGEVSWPRWLSWLAYQVGSRELGGMVQGLRLEWAGGGSGEAAGAHGCQKLVAWALATASPPHSGVSAVGSPSCRTDSAPGAVLRVQRTPPPLFFRVRVSWALAFGDSPQVIAPVPLLFPPGL